jgi:glycerate 2-kinase
VRRSSGSPRAVCAPDKLKGALSARQAAIALGNGFAKAGLEAVHAPLADGGEGTAEALEESLGGEWRPAAVVDPFGRPVQTRFLVLPDGRAVIESAHAIGLQRVAAGERDPVRASSRGLGMLIRAALEAGPSELIVGIGGTATVDGGAGLREELADLSVPTTVLADVTNPLLGERGAARVFGPQKGATPEMVDQLERRLGAMEELAPYASHPGAGAAGGLGAAFLALGARVVSGADFVIEAVRLRDRIRDAALVVTGEGVVDATSAEGKVTGAVARLCKQEGMRCAVFGGRVEFHFDGVEMHALSGDPARARADLEALGEELGRSLD